MDTSASTSPVIELRSEYAPKLVKACEKIMCVKKGNERSKSSALALLSVLLFPVVGGTVDLSSLNVQPSCGQAELTARYQQHRLDAHRARHAGHG
jgi:hypothetical protein